jgi:hypothetical protein
MLARDELIAKSVHSQALRRANSPQPIFLGRARGARVRRASVDMIENNPTHSEKGDAISFFDISFRYPSRDGLVLRELNVVVRGILQYHNSEFDAEISGET